MTSSEFNRLMQFPSPFPLIGAYEIIKQLSGGKGVVTIAVKKVMDAVAQPQLQANLSKLDQHGIICMIRPRDGGKFGENLIIHDLLTEEGKEKAEKVLSACGLNLSNYMGTAVNARHP